MTRTVFCQRLQKDAEGLDFQMYPGELGQRIYENISKQAWADWQKKQTMLINEKRLNMMDADARAFLTAQMEAYLFEGKDVEIEGYTPPENDQ